MTLKDAAARAPLAVMIHQSEKAFLNVGGHARSMHFVLCMRPPAEVEASAQAEQSAPGARWMKWRLVGIRVIQVAMDGREFDRSDEFMLSQEIDRWNKPGTERHPVKMVQALPKDVSFRMRKNDCKSNKFVVELDIDFFFGEEQARQTSRSRMVWVGTKAKSADRETYTKFVAAKMQYSEELLRSVKEINKKALEGGSFRATCKYINEHILDGHDPRESLNSDNNIIDAYHHSKKRKRSEASSGDSILTHGATHSSNGGLIGLNGGANEGNSLSPPVLSMPQAQATSAICTGSCGEEIKRLRAEVEELKSKLEGHFFSSSTSSSRNDKLESELSQHVPPLPPQT